MSIQNAPAHAPGLPAEPPAEQLSADKAYRRAWWSLVLYPISFVAAFVVGEGLVTVLTDDAVDPTVWQIVLAGTSALLVFVLPGILAVVLGRKAMRLGRRDGAVPAVVGAAIGLGFVGMNLLSYVAGLLLT